jgi:hypothetical protein
MRLIASCTAAMLVVMAPEGRAQSAPADPFNGTWRLNVEKSASLWQAQPQPKLAVPQSQSHELITMSITDGGMQYRVEYGQGNDRNATATYAAKFNDAKWQDIRGEAEGGIRALTLVKINDRVHYWVTRGKDGQFGGLIHRRLADDGRSFTSIRLGTDGYVQYVRVFDKQ